MSRYMLIVVVICSMLNTACHRLWYGDCPAPSALARKALPSHLSETGLFTHVATQALAPGVKPYRPRFELWTDGAEKSRWIALPEGAQIDTRDMNAWQMPVGTRLWKTFVRDGVRVETRMLMRIDEGADGWTGGAYVWLPDGSDAVRTLEGADDARGTPHDVPSADACRGCHGGTESFVLGFSAVQLAEARGPTTLSTLTTEGRLSHPPAHPVKLPGSSETQEVLGHFHVHCGHCHNQHRPKGDSARCYDPQKAFDLSLRTDRMERLDDTPLYTAMRVHDMVKPGHPEDSALYQCMTRGTVGFQVRMPPLGTEIFDEAGVEKVRRWIANLEGG
ncbi:MAG: hypothetical protein ACE366_21080 [Bradymonadia bacterium]